MLCFISVSMHTKKLNNTREKLHIQKHYSSSITFFPDNYEIVISQEPYKMEEYFFHSREIIGNMR